MQVVAGRLVFSSTWMDRWKRPVLYITMVFSESMYCTKLLSPNETFGTVIPKKNVILATMLVQKVYDFQEQGASFILLAKIVQLECLCKKARFERIFLYNIEIFRSKTRQIENS